MALLRVQQYPRQIEADLRFRGIKLSWWHRGTTDDEGVPLLSSRALLVLTDELPDSSGYKTALRDGNWPTWQRMLKTLTNETVLGRAAQYADSDDEYQPMIWQDPVEARERAEAEAATQALHEEAQQQMYNRFGWT